MKIANIDRSKEIFISFEWLEEIQWNFQERCVFKIILKVTKNQGFTLFLEDTIFEKLQGGRGVKLTPPPPAVLELKLSKFPGL